MAILVWAYFVTATRQSLVAIPLALLLYWAGNRNAKGMTYAVGGASLIAVSAGTFAVTGNPYALASISERLFAVPGVLSGYYFDYFANRPPVLLRDGIGGILSSSPYPREMTYQIGGEYLGRTDANANVNVIADAFANFWFGGLIVALVLAGLLILLDSATIRLPLGATMASCVLVLLALLNVGLTVALLTSGFGLAIVLLWLFGEHLFDTSEARHRSI
jgi:O-antigen polymerase